MPSKLHSFLFILSTLFVFQLVDAQQLTPQEKKKIKNQLKMYMKNPGIFKKEKEMMANELATLNKKMVTMKERAENAESNLQKAQSEATRLREEADVKDQIIADLNKRLNSSSGYCQPGEYKVQIGKFDKFSMESYLQNGKCINFEVQGGVKIYTIDGFNDPKEAFNMAQQLRRMGLKGAFVTRFKNNKRIPYDHVAETGEQPIYDIAENGTAKPKPAAQKTPPTPPAPKKEPVKVEYISTGVQNERNEGYGNTNVKPEKKVVNKIIEPEEEEDVIQDEGAELNEMENKEIRMGGDKEESEEVEIKESTKPNAPATPATTPNKVENMKLNLPATKPQKEENFEDYEEVKEIPENKIN